MSTKVFAGAGVLTALTTATCVQLAVARQPISPIRVNQLGEQPGRAEEIVNG